ncbi:MAG: Hsp20/alpha crystallin family protein [Gammaproteobacteria bacterium]
MAEREQSSSGNTPQKSSGQEIQSRSRGNISPFDEIERAFDDFSRGNWLFPLRTSWPFTSEKLSAFEGKQPRVDVINQEKNILVKAELPGVEKDNLDVTLSDNQLTIRGKTEKKQEEEKGDYFHREISSGEYVRTVLLPAEVDDKKAKATFKNGLLEMTIPKLETSKRSKIKIED